MKLVLKDQPPRLGKVFPLNIGAAGGVAIPFDGARTINCKRSRNIIALRSPPDDGTALGHALVDYKSRKTWQV